MANKVAGVVQKLVEALEVLKKPEERLRAAQAALTVFGDSPALLGDTRASAGNRKNEPGADPLPGGDGIHPTGVAWMKRNNLTREQLDETFHVDEQGASLLKVPGKGKRQQTVNAYLLTGLAALLQNGKPDFSDEAARTNCTSHGCYDMANHSKYLKEFGNTITGSKNAGWKITAPGQSAAAELLKAPLKQETK